MLKTLLRDAAVYGAATVLTRAISLFLVPIYTRVLVPAEYGAIDILAIFGNLVTLTVALEISQAVARFLPDASDEAERRQLVTTAAVFSVVVYSAFLVVALLLVDPLRSIVVGDAISTGTMALALVSIWLTGIFQLGQTVLRFSMRPAGFTVASLAYSLVSIGVSVALVVGARAGVAGVLGGQVAGGIVGTLVAAWLARRLFGAAFSGERLRAMLTFSAPLVPASIGVFVTLYVDRIALNALASLASVGVFGIGYRLASVVTLLMIGFQMALTPLIYERYREASTPPELARVFRLFVAFAALLGLTLSVWSPEILRVATPAAYHGADVVVPLLTPAIMLANMYVFMPGLAIAKRTRTMGLLTIGGAVLNTALNIVLIPVLDIRGAALATLTSAVAVFLAYIVTSQRHYPVPHDWRRLAAATGGYVIAVVLGLAVGHGTVLAVLAKLVLTVGMVAVIVATGLIAPGEIRAAVERLRRRSPATPTPPVA